MSWDWNQESKPFSSWCSSFSSFVHFWAQKLRKSVIARLLNFWVTLSLLTKVVIPGHLRSYRKYNVWNEKNDGEDVHNNLTLLKNYFVGIFSYLFCKCTIQFFIQCFLISTWKPAYMLGGFGSKYVSYFAIFELKICRIIFFYNFV